MQAGQDQMNVMVLGVAMDSCDPPQPIDSEIGFDSGYGHPRQLLQIQPNSALGRNHETRHSASPIQYVPVAGVEELRL